MTAGGTVTIQAEESISIIATQETITISTFKTLVVTSEMRELMVQLAPILPERTNAPPPPYKNTTTTTVEPVSGSAL